MGLAITAHVHQIADHGRPTKLSAVAWRRARWCDRSITDSTGTQRAARERRSARRNTAQTPQASPVAREGRCTVLEGSTLRLAPRYNCRRGKTGRKGTMPIYEYRCQQCGERFEQRESLAQHEVAKPKCPKCGGEKVTRAFTGFYAKTSKKS